MRSPHEMDQNELADLVSQVQRQLYFESDPERTVIWNPSKDVDCQAFVDILDELMARTGLHPASTLSKRPLEVEFEAEESLSGPLKRNPDLSITEGRLVGYLSPNMKLVDILFPPTLSKVLLMSRTDVESLRSLCAQLLEFMP